jgi:hypothetical protein
LGSHLAFYPAASQCFAQVEQISHDHIFGEIVRIYISIINKEITKLSQIMTNSKRTVMTNR